MSSDLQSLALRCRHAAGLCSEVIGRREGRVVRAARVTPSLWLDRRGGWWTISGGRAAPAIMTLAAADEPELRAGLARICRAAAARCVDWSRQYERLAEEVEHG